MTNAKDNAPPNTPESQSDKSDDQIPKLFATIHFRSERRANGYTSNEIELLNIEANKHLPDLYEKLKAARDERLAMEAREDR